jgi:hypothetical protein
MENLKSQDLTLSVFHHDDLIISEGTDILLLRVS